MDEQGARELIGAIVAAENADGEKGRNEAEDRLSKRFIRLTRGGRPESGKQEATREQFLEAIGAALPDSPRRSLTFDDEHSGTWPIGSECWVVRGVVGTKDGRFRNTWILRHDEDSE